MFKICESLILARNTVLPNDLRPNAIQAGVREKNSSWVCPPVPERGEEYGRRGCLPIRPRIRRDRGHIGKYLSLARGTLGVPRRPEDYKSLIQIGTRCPAR